MQIPERTLIRRLARATLTLLLILGAYGVAGSLRAQPLFTDGFERTADWAAWQAGVLKGVPLSMQQLQTGHGGNYAFTINGVTRKGVQILVIPAQEVLIACAFTYEPALPGDELWFCGAAPLQERVTLDFDHIALTVPVFRGSPTGSFDGTLPAPAGESIGDMTLEWQGLACSDLTMTLDVVLGEFVVEDQPWLLHRTHAPAGCCLACVNPGFSPEGVDTYACPFGGEPMALEDTGLSCTTGGDG